MAKNGFKMVDFLGGASHMKNNNIFNIFYFSTLSLGYFLDPVLELISLNFGKNTGFVNHQRK